MSQHIIICCMKIAEVAEAEREAPQGLFEVTFEVIEPFDFHEKIVAVSALGSLVRSSIAAVPLVETRRNEAKLAMTINALKHTEGEEKVDVSMDMQDKDL